MTLCEWVGCEPKNMEYLQNSDNSVNKWITMIKITNVDSKYELNTLKQQMLFKFLPGTIIVYDNHLSRDTLTSGWTPLIIHNLIH